MALCLLWASFDMVAREGLRLGTTIRNQFIADFEIDMEEETPTYNPIEKVNLHVINSAGRLRIVKIRNTEDANAVEEDNNPTYNAAPQDTNNANTQQLLVLLSNIEQRQIQQFEMYQQALFDQRDFILRELQTINNNVRRYGGTLQSAFAHQQRTQVMGTAPTVTNRFNLFRPTHQLIDTRAGLHPKPRDLFMMWQEYTIGIGERKAAKDFTMAERNNRIGGIKQKYWRRSHVWHTQAKLVDGGMSIVAANALILRVTGARTVTQAIDKIIGFKRLYKESGGIHPELQYGPARRLPQQQQQQMVNV
jgi:hypothetical protein